MNSTRGAFRQSSRSLLHEKTNSCQKKRSFTVKELLSVAIIHEDFMPVLKSLGNYDRGLVCFTKPEFSTSIVNGTEISDLLVLQAVSVSTGLDVCNSS